MNRPPAFHVMAKPTGARCNLHCDYCFFLEKDQLYPGSNFRMSDEVMERYIRQTIAGQAGEQVEFAWQGGEPTLMGLDFFRRAIALQRSLAKPGMRIENSLQTNGVLIDSEWCAFLRENGFLVGISIDGPRELHDAFRHDKGGNSVFDRVVGAVRLMQEHRVEFNVLCTVNAVNGRRPLEVYRFFRDELRTPFVQFIPIVERGAGRAGAPVTDRSVRSLQYGRFLNAIFDEWVRRDVGKIFVQTFDAVLASYVQGCSSLCAFSPVCGTAVALEHNGDVYSCDHFVEPGCLLGNIADTPLAELVGGERQRRFGRAKSDRLPRACRECEFLFACHGECPRNRVLPAAEGEDGLNWLCTGLREFFAHTRPYMERMAGLLRCGQPAARIMETEAANRPGGGKNAPSPRRRGKR